MSLSQATCFVFDFDGTLAPNLDLPEMRRQVIELTQREGVPAEAFEDHYIIEIIDAAHAWLRQQRPAAADGYRSRARRFIEEFELEAASRLQPFPAARALLTRLRQDGKHTAVVTRNCQQAVRNTFPDIDAHMDLVLARDNVPHVKPDPRHLGVVLEALDASPRNSVMVGDGPMDMQLGATLGFTCVGVLTGSSTGAALRASGASLILDSIAELEHYL